MNLKNNDYDRGVAEVKAYYDLHKSKDDHELTARTTKALFLRGLAICIAIGFIFEFLFN